EGKGIDQIGGTNVFQRKFFVDLRQVVEDLVVFVDRNVFPFSPGSLRLKDLSLEVKSSIVRVGHRRVFQSLAIIGHELGMIEHAREDDPAVALGNLLGGEFGSGVFFVLGLIGELATFDQLALEPFFREFFGLFLFALAFVFALSLFL